MNPRLHKKLANQGRRRKRRRYVRVAATLCGFTLLFGGAFAYAVRAERFQIKSVAITGLDRTSESEVRSAISAFLETRRLYVFPQANMLFIDTAGAASLLKQSFSTLKDVDVSRTLRGELAFSVVEYDPWGVLCPATKNDCYWIDRNGVAFETAPEYSGLVVPKIVDYRSYDLELGKQYLTEQIMNLVTFFNERAVNDEHLQSLQFSIDAKDQTLRVTTRAGWDILLLGANDPEEAYRNLRIALEGDIKEKISQLEYIDLRFGKRIFYKLHSGEQEGL